MLDLTDRKRAAERLKAEEELLRKLLDLQERERQLFAYEIHDGFLQYAVGAHMGLEAVRDALATTNPEAADRPPASARSGWSMTMWWSCPIYSAR